MNFIDLIRSRFTIARSPKNGRSDPAIKLFLYFKVRLFIMNKTLQFLIYISSLIYEHQINNVNKCLMIHKEN